MAGHAWRHGIVAFLYTARGGGAECVPSPGSDARSKVLPYQAPRRVRRCSGRNINRSPVPRKEGGQGWLPLNPQRAATQQSSLPSLLPLIPSPSRPPMPSTYRDPFKQVREVRASVSRVGRPLPKDHQNTNASEEPRGTRPRPNRRPTSPPRGALFCRTASCLSGTSGPPPGWRGSRSLGQSAGSGWR